jgi:hypothetical protein
MVSEVYAPLQAELSHTPAAEIIATGERELCLQKAEANEY